jgi:uncharacterized membrane protein YphA (DoxX/SURF4 family)
VSTATFVHAFEGLLTAVFIGSGSLKLADLRGHIAVIERYELLPARAAAVAGAVLPVVELGAGLALLLRIAVQPALACMLLLLLWFTVSMSVKLGQRKRVPCGCFGASSSELVGWRPIARNLLLCGGAIIALASDVGSPVPSDWLILVAAGVVICLGAAQLSVAARLLRQGRE